MCDVSTGWVKLLVAELVERIRTTQERDKLIEELSEGIIEAVDDAVKAVRADDERKMREKLKALGLTPSQIDALFD